MKIDFFLLAYNVDEKINVKFRDYPNSLNGRWKNNLSLGN